MTAVVTVSQHLDTDKLRSAALRSEKHKAYHEIVTLILLIMYSRLDH